MFIWITDEDGEAAVGRVPWEWSSGKQKFIVAMLMYSTNVLKYVCVLSSLFDLKDLFCTGPGQVVVPGSLYTKRNLLRIVLLLVPCVSE